jgi:hypothetical protein
VLGGIDLSAGEGLEFEPGQNALIGKASARVFHVSRQDAPGLDVVWSEGSLRQALLALPGPEKWFVYAVARLVIQRVPDLVWWLAELRSVLISGGALRLVVPDRRFTEDFARRETEFADVMAAYLAGSRRPQPREVLDCHVRQQPVDLAAAWHGTQRTQHMFSLEQATRGIRLAQAALAGEYVDVACWVFTPDSFLQLMVDLARHGLIWFACERIVPTAEYRRDFCVHLRAADDRQEIEESWRGVLRGAIA